MIFDCAIIGGGPAGLNAALVLGRARRKMVLFDDNKPRNAVTQESHGFITRDGVKPSEFREIAHRDIAKYPDVQFRPDKVTQVTKENEGEITFELVTEVGESYRARTIILATGLKEIFPSIPGIRDYYGKSIFSCPYCDGWELRNKPLVAITETEHAYRITKVVSNWSKDVILCTNGSDKLTPEQRQALKTKQISVYDQKIHSLAGANGLLKQIKFEDGSEILREGGFLAMPWKQATTIAESLGCEINTHLGIVTDVLGRTNIPGVYAAGDMSVNGPAQLINAAAEGSKAAIGVNTDLIEKEFI
ncbi:NAD(P)/FAD-dependent oxidoreductase [Paenibacillus sp. SYP-B3998]|uniref:NAD(P)/FAD-dependent oxidoreductase n=1 Tax=Paenibacillus sp. SYP-B3998 TaxID=2678564 RepID=A0A6G4A6K8_9BACL|nr:NAD(P)/FAD-dependent oxidoreductase [Paenibacillus sp. SYP-B3998]NEW09267.1 NAD(P)/FAD-dependent oxidoreductase [Paenibacillus sp. SYP-B3998]